MMSFYGGCRARWRLVFFAVIVGCGSESTAPESPGAMDSTGGYAGGRPDTSLQDAQDRQPGDEPIANDTDGSGTIVPPTGDVVDSGSSAWDSTVSAGDDAPIVDASNDGVSGPIACRARAFGDQGNGTYVNQILPGDYQNTDVVRVGDDFYYITATKALSPGMQVLHSKDLVNWTAIGHVVSDITAFGPGFNYDRMQDVTRGVWAGSITHHGDLFYVYFTTPDEGLYVSSASNPAGPWSPLTRMIAGGGWDDPAPLWDDDGQGYLATTRFGADPQTGTTYNIHLFKLTSDGKSLVTSSDTVIYRGQGSEANKLYKINGYYYHFFSQVTGEGRVPYMRRAKVITGPYEAAHAINHVSAADREPNQGAILEAAAGKWVFITHHGNADWYGRGASLLPVTWLNDWPEAGRVGADGIGNMVTTGTKPILGYPVTKPQGDDDFSSAALSPQWEWLFQPRANKWSLTERPGFLRLYAFKPLAAGDLAKTGNVLTQRPWRADDNVATVTLDVAHMSDGQIAGLGFLGSDWATVGVMQEQGVRRFVYTQKGHAITRGPTLSSSQTTVRLQSSWNAAASATFAVSADRTTFSPLGSTFKITNFGNYLGAKLVIYTANDQQEAGYVDFDEFSYPCSGH